MQILRQFAVPVQMTQEIWSPAISPPWSDLCDVFADLDSQLLQRRRHQNPTATQAPDWHPIHFTKFGQCRVVLQQHLQNKRKPKIAPKIQKFSTKLVNWDEALRL
jgi:hypothetical protein